MLGLGAGIDYALLHRRAPPRAAARPGRDPARGRRPRQRHRGHVRADRRRDRRVVAIAGLLATGIPFVGRMGVGRRRSSSLRSRVGAVTRAARAARRVRAAAACPPPRAHVEPSQRAFAALGARASRAGPPCSPSRARSPCSRSPRPSVGLRLGQPDDGNDAGSTPPAQVAYDRLAEGFGPGFNGPLVLAVAMPPTADGHARAARSAGVAGATASVAARRRAPVAQRGRRRRGRSPSSRRTRAAGRARPRELVDRLRDDVIPRDAAPARRLRRRRAPRRFGDLAGEDREPAAAVHRRSSSGSRCCS